MADVVTIGHILMDMRVLVDEFATPDKEATVYDIKYGAGGSAANTAVGVVRLGRKASVIAKVGMDNFGRLVLEEVMTKGVDISGVKIKVGGDTGFTIVLINSRGEIIMYGYKGVSEELLPEEIDKEIIEKAKHVHIASLRIDTAVHAARIARELDKKVSWDPGRRIARMGLEKLSEIIGLSNIVLLNEKEAEEMTGYKDYHKAAQAIRDRGAEIVIVKRGEKGVYALAEDCEIELPAYKVKAVDTTGAGDSFAAGLIVSLLEGRELREALEFANATAALKVTRLGAQVIPTRDEVEIFLRQQKKFEEILEGLAKKSLEEE